MTLFRGSDSAGQGSGVEFLRSDRDLSDVDSPSNSRSNLGLGSLATQSSSSIAVTGGTITGLTSLGANTLDTGQGANELYAMDQAVRTTDAVTFATLNTGQGANELYPMDQAVQTTDAVTFATVNTGQGANELYAMDQAVQTTDDVTFNTVDTSEVVNCQNTATAWVRFDGSGTVTIDDDYNVDSITDNGTGSYTVNFTTALADTNYAYVSGSGGAQRSTVNPITTTACGISTSDSSGAAQDHSPVSVIVFGGEA